MPSSWHVLPADAERARRLAREVGIEPLTAQLLLNRGVSTPADARRFLAPTLESLEDPMRLSGMARAAERFGRAIARGEPILIFGDCDVDGLTAASILYELLRGLGAAVVAHQSNRIADGYGMPQRIVDRICRSSTAVVVLVDCGTNQPDAVEALERHGIETVIIDHHVPSARPAKPYALINPHCEPAGGYQELSSAGLALKVAQALLQEEAPGALEAYLDLAALGTLADCSPLRGENRIIAAEGLPRLINSPRAGIRRLCHATKTSKPEPDHIARRLVPRLNASGRLGAPTAVWHLLIEQDPGRLENWMAAAHEAHATTKRLQRRIMAEAQEQVNRLHFRDELVMVVSRSGWHQGLMGPLASQLAERYGRPAIALAVDQGRGTGSGRSIPLFNLLAAVSTCQEVLLRFGGHAQACGLTLEIRHLDRFRALVNAQARQSLDPEALTAKRTVDLELPLQAVEGRWVDELDRLAPFGNGAPRPSVAIRCVAVEPQSPRVAMLRQGSCRVAARGRFPAPTPGERYDVVARPARVNGELILLVSDVRGSAGPSGSDRTSGTPCTRAPASRCR